MHTGKYEFHGWSEQAVAQGFNWIEGSVSFGVPDYEGEFLITLIIDEVLPNFGSDIEREIKVPFRARNTAISIATIFNDDEFNISVGLYQLTFLLLKNRLFESEEYKYEAIFHLIKHDQPIYKIIKQGEEMSSLKVIEPIGKQIK